MQDKYILLLKLETKKKYKTFKKLKNNLKKKVKLIYYNFLISTKNLDLSKNLKIN